MSRGEGGVRSSAGAVRAWRASECSSVAPSGVSSSPLASSRIFFDNFDPSSPSALLGAGPLALVLRSRLLLSLRLRLPAGRRRIASRAQGQVTGAALPGTARRRHAGLAAASRPRRRGASDVPLRPRGSLPATSGQVVEAVGVEQRLVELAPLPVPHLHEWVGDDLLGAAAGVGAFLGLFLDADRADAQPERESYARLPDPRMVLWHGRCSVSFAPPQS